MSILNVLMSAYLTLNRLSLPTISPSFRHPFLLDLSNTSQSFFTAGSFNKLIFVDRSKEESDMMEPGKKSLPSTLIRLKTLVLHLTTLHFTTKKS